MYTGFFIHARDLVENVRNPDFVKTLGEYNPDEIVIDAFTNGGLQFRRLLPELMKLQTRLTVLLPCYFVSGLKVAESVKEITQLFGGYSVMFNVIIDVQDTDLVDEFANQFAWNVDNNISVTVCGQPNFFKKGSSAIMLYEALCRNLPNVSISLLCNDTEQGLASLKATMKKLDSSKVTIAPFVLNANYDELFAINRPVLFWNYRDYMSLPDVTSEEDSSFLFQAKALHGPLSARDQPSKSGTVVGKIKKAEYVKITDVIEEIAHGIEWGRTVDGYYVVLRENNTPNFEIL